MVTVNSVFLTVAARILR